MVYLFILISIDVVFCLGSIFAVTPEWISVGLYFEMKVAVFCFLLSLLKLIELSLFPFLSFVVSLHPSLILFQCSSAVL